MASDGAARVAGVQPAQQGTGTAEQSGAKHAPSLAPSEAQSTQLLLLLLLPHRQASPSVSLSEALPPSLPPEAK